MNEFPLLVAQCVTLLYMAHILTPVVVNLQRIRDSGVAGIPQIPLFAFYILLGTFCTHWFTVGPFRVRPTSESRKGALLFTLRVGIVTEL